MARFRIAILGQWAGTSPASSNQNQKLLPRGSFFRIRGQLDTMRTSYDRLAGRTWICDRPGLLS